MGQSGVHGFMMFAVAGLVSSETAPAFQRRFRQDPPLKYFPTRLSHLAAIMPCAETPRLHPRGGAIFAGIHGLLRAFGEKAGWQGPARSNNEEMIQSNRNAP
jgi:hypothetical protein